MDNQDRANRALVAVKTDKDFNDGPHGNDLATAIVDLLCNLRHLCSQSHLRYDDLDADALGHFGAEIDEENEVEAL